MANTIKIKSKSTAGAPTAGQMVTRELVVGETDNSLWYKKESDSAIVQLNLNTNRIVLQTAATVSSTSITVTDLAGMNVNLTAGNIYKINIMGIYSTASTTTGIKLGLRMSSGTARISGLWTALITTAVAATAVAKPISDINATYSTATVLITASVSAINAELTALGEFILNCTTDGVLSIGFATEIASSAAQLKIGFTSIVDKL